MSQEYGDRNRLLWRMGFASYEEYLASDLWKSIRRRAFKLYGSVCSLCGSPAKVIHHKGYGKRVLTGETLKPLVPLCRACHRTVEYDADGKKHTLLEAQIVFAAIAKEVGNKHLPQRGVKRQSPSKAAVKRMTAGSRAEVVGYCGACGKHKAMKGRTICRPCMTEALKREPALPRFERSRPKKYGVSRADIGGVVKVDTNKYPVGHCWKCGKWVGTGMVHCGEHSPKNLGNAYRRKSKNKL